MADIKDFAALKALILEEWPGIDGAALDGTGGDDDQLVTVIAAHTEHTRALCKKQLAELRELAASKPAPAEQLEALVRRLEARVSDTLGHVKRDLVPQAEGRVKDNLLTSLISALVVGLILGLMLGGRRGR